MGDVTSKSSPVATVDASPPMAAPDPSGFGTALSIPAGTANQLNALIQPGAGLLATSWPWALSPGSFVMAKPSAAAGSNGKDRANNVLNEATGLKQHPPSASDETGSQETAPSGDQGQSGASQQGQIIAPAQMNFANHTIAAIDHSQNASIASPLQAAPTPAGISGHNAKTPETAAPASITMPQALPVINTAKLIQTMGQSEMRVGMRSNDFGNISISTSATRDLISAQISVDHGELARVITAHVPEIQARFGGNQAMEVRIDMNGQSAGTSASMSNGSADESRSGRQQKGGPTPGHAVSGFAEQGHSVAVAMLTRDSELDARLDIRA
jgi:hypothetical protein